MTPTRKEKMSNYIIVPKVAARTCFELNAFQPVS